MFWSQDLSGVPKVQGMGEFLSHDSYRFLQSRGCFDRNRRWGQCVDRTEMVDWLDHRLIRKHVRVVVEDTLLEFLELCKILRAAHLRFVEVEEH